MRERTEQVLRLACLVLGALLLFQIGRIFIHRNPVAHLQIPALPTLAEAEKADHTNGLPDQTHPAESATHPGGSPAGMATNFGAGALASKGDTNSTTENAPRKADTNAPASKLEAKTQAGQTSASGEGQPRMEVAGGEHVEAVQPTNLAAKVHRPAASETNTIAAHSSSNSTPAVLAKSSTNSLPHSSNGPPPGVLARMPGGPGGPMRPGMPPRLPDLPPEILARVDRVIDSEILGPIMHPLPMALLGIAGNVAFLRAPSGQTGLVKEGDKLGEIKLLKIGINRVLVDEDGQKQELMIFSGLGGDSLLPNEHKTSP